MRAGHRAAAVEATIVVVLVWSLLLVAVVGGNPAGAGRPSAAARLERALERLVDRPDGPPGAIVVIRKDERTRTHVAGVAELGSDVPPEASDAMRVASVSKAFSGAVSLALVSDGILSLDDTIGEHLPHLPESWHPISLRELLAHTSGLPDFSGTEAFGAAVAQAPETPPPPIELLSFVAEDPLAFEPGSRYEYSNTDNVVIALLVEAATGVPYAEALARFVLEPLGLEHTELPTGSELPAPFLHGYAAAEDDQHEDVSEVIAFGGWAFASGGLVSTPAELERFVTGYVQGELFDERVRDEQRDFTRGRDSEPEGPGANAGGLALFRYRTRCGTVLGHTGSILGFTQLIAASPDGSRALTFTITTQVTDDLRPLLRRAQVRAVCAALEG